MNNDKRMPAVLMAVNKGRSFLHCPLQPSHPLLSPLHAFQARYNRHLAIMIGQTTIQCVAVSKFSGMAIASLIEIAS